MQIDNKLKVFISYSRDDLDIAQEIASGLTHYGGFEVIIDLEAVSGGEDWKSKLGALIEQSDAIVFVLSPKSVQSPICQWEVEEAERLSKRIFPARYRPLGDIPLPAQLSRIQHVDFTSSRPLMESISELVTSLKQDSPWLQESTRLLNLAIGWQKANRLTDRLLSGKDILDAKKWMAECPSDSEITDLHRDFIRSSETHELFLESAENLKLKKLAEMQKKNAQVSRTLYRRTLAAAILITITSIYIIISYLDLSKLTDKFKKAQSRINSEQSDKKTAQETLRVHKRKVRELHYQIALAKKKQEENEIVIQNLSKLLDAERKAKYEWAIKYKTALRNNQLALNRFNKELETLQKKHDGALHQINNLTLKLQAKQQQSQKLKKEYEKLKQDRTGKKSQMELTILKLRHDMRKSIKQALECSTTGANKKQQVSDTVKKTVPIQRPPQKETKEIKDLKYQIAELETHLVNIQKEHSKTFDALKACKNSKHASVGNRFDTSNATQKPPLTVESNKPADKAQP